ncbi:TonB-linked outer membrane protein, SusC/RagA family [Chitinophaga costaii]|uniref:TonB-linked outer membrane protein, SusC/RagA family n=1 Tax=Chitinophaga costaii TaxID=1335309 RepID=A0A1C4EZN6_9BACT|nr:SusC/RagA family TonB-linked outer membrane protein [Chitinophaga costaii]SCC48855.1 TonB-linked outer membrane protein, SusC/RagA family [Chitinophaga costaii]
MKLTSFLCLLGCLHVSATAFSQNINLSEKDASLKSILNKLEQQSGYTFFYNADLVRQAPHVNVEIQNATLQQALDACFQAMPLHYTLIDNTVVITRRNIDFVKPMNALAPIVFIGRIIDEAGNPLPGVTVKIKYTNYGAVTNKDGQFTLLVPDKDNNTLVITFIGYTSQEVSTSTLKSPLIITLKENVSSLDEVQILAYGQTSKRLLTGNITTITAKEIGNNPVTNVLSAIEGRVPGLYITQNSGLPSSSFTTQIRGNSSFNGTNPLFVVDGVTYPANDNLSFLSNGDLNNSISQGSSALNFLDPSEIESVTVMKDADATAIYGSRGANGVILITTKKAKSGIPQLSINARLGESSRGTAPKLMNTAQYLAMRREAFANDNATPKASDLDLNGAWSQTAYTNWPKYTSGIHALNSDVNVAYGGGNGNVNYRISGQYAQQDAVQLGGGSVKTLGLRFDINSTSPNKKFYFDMSGGFSSTTNNTKPGDFSNVSLSTQAPNMPALIKPDGQLNWDNLGGNQNLLQKVKLLYNATTNNLLSNTVLSYHPIAGLSINATIGYNLLLNRDFRGQPTDYYQPVGNVALQTQAARSEFSVRTWTLDPNIDYTFKLGSKGTLDARAGGTLVDKLNPYSSITGVGFIGDALLYNPATAASVVANYTQVQERNLGYFGILKYNWADKYLLSLNGRYDGSTKFGSGKQFGAFWSVGAGWIFTEESWLKDRIPFLSFGKLRGSYGITGNDGIPNYLFLSTYSTALSYDGKPGLSPTRLSNPDLQWEQIKKREVGLYLEFFNGRIAFDGDYYNDITSHQLVTSFLSSVTGFTQYPINSPAIIRNNGAELSLTTYNIKTKQFTWSTGINITIPRATLVSYPGLSTSAVSTSYIVGKSPFLVRLYNYAGVDPQTGSNTYINKKGDKGAFIPFLSPEQLDINTDRTKYIDLSPKYFGGISNSFSYKGFHLDVFFECRNRMGRNMLGAQSQMPGLFNVNTTTQWLKRWQHPGDVTDVPKVSQGISSILGWSNFSLSTGAYERVIYARMANLNFSYSLPQALLKKAHIRNGSIFFQGQNLLTISKYKGGLDPENLTPGSLPPLRILTGGISLNL